MRLHTNLFIFIILTGLASATFGQQAATSSQMPDSEKKVSDVNVPAFPYHAEITGDNVYIRSGPGTNFYDCSKLNKGDKVKVVSTQFSWSRIVPPAGSFSWISMQHIRIDPEDPNIGVVTGDNVRVYAGSNTLKPLYSTKLQGKLNKGDKVNLLGEQMDDYYKIAPPPFAYLWVSTNFTKPLAPIGKVPPTVKPTADLNDTAVGPRQMTKEVSPETMLEEYHALRKQIQAERIKPIDQQNYANIKKALSQIAENDQAGKAARFAEFALQQVEDFELVLAVNKQVQLQDEQLQKIMERIDKACATRIAQVEDLGKFAVIGKLQPFTTYGPGHYRIVDETNTTLCYAFPTGQAVEMDLSNLIDRKVGLMGTIEPHMQTTGALVRFTKIVELKQ